MRKRPSLKSIKQQKDKELKQNAFIKSKKRDYRMSKLKQEKTNVKSRYLEAEKENIKGRDISFFFESFIFL